MTITADLRAATEQTGLRLTSQSQERLDPETRRLHQVILQALADPGTAPARRWLDDQAAHLGLDPGAALAELADADLVHLADGSVLVAYPFSGVPTDDRVQLDGGPSVFAMGAIDALGVLLMTGRDGVITSTDPHSGEPIRVERQKTTWTWAPASTVVLAGLAQPCNRSRGVLSPRRLLRRQPNSRRLHRIPPRAHRCGPRPVRRAGDVRSRLRSALAQRRTAAPVRPFSQPVDEYVAFASTTPELGGGATVPPVRIQLLHVPDCPNLGELRRRVAQTIDQLAVSAVVEEVEGPYPSPTLLVNGDDVTGRLVGSDPSCRLWTPPPTNGSSPRSPESPQRPNPPGAQPRHRVQCKEGSPPLVTTHDADRQTGEPASTIATAFTCGRALCGWSPASLSADTSLRRAADIVRVGNVAAVGVLVVVIGLLNLAPHLALRPSLVVDASAALVGSGRCSLNFWRCRHAHCLISGPGWLALAVFAFIEAGVGHSMIGGNEQLVFLAVLGVALAFEAEWYLRRHTNAVMSA